MLDKQKRSATQGLSFTQILDRSFRIYRQNFLPFFVLSAIVQIPLLIVTRFVALQQQQTLLNSGFTGSTTAMSFTDVQAMLGPILTSEIILIVVGLVSAFFENMLIYGPIVYVASENHLGRKPSLGEGFAALGKRLQPLAGGLGVFYLILIVFGAAIGLALCLCGLGIGLIFYVGLVLGSLLVPVLVLERTNIGTGLRRSWSLGKSRLWVLLGITIGLNVVITAIDLALAAALNQIFRNNASTVADVLIAILGSLGTLALAPLVPITLTEIYYDARNRFEGLDIALKAATVPNPSPADVPSPAPGQLIGNEDYLNIALFAIGTLVILLILYFGLVTLVGPRAFGI